MLPTPYFHLVFTLPDALNPIALTNPRVVYDLLLRSAAETVIRDGDLSTIATPIDFLGVNSYRRHVVSAGNGRPRILRPEGEYTTMGWEIYPEGLHRLLVRIAHDYAPAAAYLTESGAAFGDVRGHDGEVQDLERVVSAAGLEIRLAKYFDLPGIIPWYLAFVLLGRDLTAGGVSLYDRLVVPIARRIESALPGERWVAPASPTSWRSCSRIRSIRRGVQRVACWRCARSPSRASWSS